MNKILKRRPISNNVTQFDDALHPILQRIYRLRGLSCLKDLTRSTNALIGYDTLTGMETAVGILYRALTENRFICIVGDFDADGATSAALVIRVLTALGVNNVMYLVPDRFTDGYGLSDSVVRRANERRAELIITVDNGISSFSGVTLAKSLGMEVIITDHHLPSITLPDADAIINPNLPDCSFPSKHLAGVGVAFYFMLALRAHLRALGWFRVQGRAELNMSSYLDLVALGTIADVVVLDKNNRILVYQGIKRLQRGLNCVGIQALLDVVKKKNGDVTASDLGYLLAPRLNAAGRIKNMGIGIELLLTQDPEYAQKIAQKLDALNTERRQIEHFMQRDAVNFVNQIEDSLDSIPHGIVIYRPEWHQGIIGIVSARIKDRYYRPVISFADSDNATLKGSGRSIAGFHLRDALERIDTLNPGLITCFGGHAMAAGLTLAKKNLSQFQQCFAEITREMIDDDLLNHVILSDGELPQDYFTMNVAELIKEGGPWGQGFPEPLFDGNFYLYQQRIVGEKHLKVVVEPCQSGLILEGIAFNVDRQRWPDSSIKKVKLAYHLDINEFRGQKKVQLLIRYLWPQE